MDQNQENKDKKMENLEKLEKATQALDRGVKMADEKLSAVPGMLGEHKSKVMLILVIAFGIALFRDTSLALIIGLISVVVYSSSIVAVIKKQVEKSATKKEESKQIEEKKEEQK